MAGKKGRSGATTKREKATWKAICQKGCNYINLNFHKFNQKTKIYVALEVMKKVEKTGFEIDVTKPLEINIICTESQKVITNEDN